MELKAGGANAGILDKPAADYFVATDGKGAFRVVDVPDSKVQYFAFGFNKDNKELQQEGNAMKTGSIHRLRICLPQQKKHWESSNIKTSLQKRMCSKWFTSFLIALIPVTRYVDGFS